ncbi:MAG: hypothetical protein ACYCYE_11400 [Clostridia bacterium]
MGNGQNPAQTAFMGMSREQMAKILYEEFSKSGFQFNNFNTMIPSIINRVLMEKVGMAGNYLAQMLINGMMGNFFKR